MKFLEVSDKTVDSAIFKGLNELGLSIDEVEIEIVQQDTRGILGIGKKDAIVRLTQKPEDEVIIPDFAELAREGRRERSDDRRKSGNTDRNRNDRPCNDRRGDKPPEGREARPGAPKQDRPPKQEHRPQVQKPQPIHEISESICDTVAPTEVAVPTPAIGEKKFELTIENAANEEGAIFLKGMLTRMGIECEMLAGGDENELAIQISSPSMALIIGHRGETLDSLQYLTSLVVNKHRKEDGYRRVTVDIEGYRQKREETLVKLARRVAQQVKQTGRPRTLEPMNPYERRILHSTLQSNVYVTTHSVGDEPNRRVVVSPKRRRPSSYRSCGNNRPTQANAPRIESNGAVTE